MTRLATLLALFLFLTLSCEKPMSDEVSLPVETEKDGNLTLHIAFGESRSGRSLDDYFGTVNFVIYQDGTKVKAFTQHSGGSGYGDVSVTLAPGTYQVLALAHSSTANPTLAHPNEIYFANKNSFSDTFYYYANIEVTEEPRQYTLTLERVSSCVRFIIEDEIPANVATMLFQYTGGSGTFNALTGYGCKDSQQYMEFPVDHTKGAPYVFDVYTILKGEEGELSLTVRGLKKDGISFVDGLRKNFTVPVRRQENVDIRGKFFSEGGGNPDDSGNEKDPDTPSVPSDSTSFVIVVDTVWHLVNHLTY